MQTNSTLRIATPCVRVDGGFALGMQKRTCMLANVQNSVTICMFPILVCAFAFHAHTSTCVRV